jgi:glycosyltransferase involved in cell wall biosynthesis
MEQVTPSILFLDHAGALGGAELYLLDIIHHHQSKATVVTLEDGDFPKQLRADGVDVQVLSSSGALKNVKKKAPLTRALRAIPDVLKTARSVAKLAESHDVVYANSQKALVVGGIAGWWSGRPVIWNLHDILTADHFSALNRWVAVQWSRWFVDRIIVNSEATRAAYIASGGSAERTGLVYNGIDSSPFDEVDSSTVRRIRSELGIDAVPTVGVFSRLAPWKGQHVLINALADLPNVHAVLVGEALFKGDDPYARRLRTLAHQLGIAERIHFLGFRRDIPQLMKAVDIVAHTSTAPEPFGRVIVEGQLAQRPVVATEAGGALEIIGHGDTGFLIPPDNPEALARTIQRLIDEPTLAHSVAQRGRTVASDRFSTTRMLNAVNNELATVLSST